MKAAKPAATKETAAEAPAREERAGYPAWFDPTKHRATGAGIDVQATGVMLGDDGEPRFVSDKLLMAMAAEAEAARREAEAATTAATDGEA